jgi:hypothetical protein
MPTQVEGRNSPDPDHQTDAQQGAMANPHNQGARTSPKAASQTDQLANLGSNPISSVDTPAMKSTAKD